MRGDRLIIQEGHTRAARQVAKRILPRITSAEDRFVVTIAGESGSGKSEIAQVLSELLSEKGIDSVILQQDDYFVYPPKTNALMRRKDIGYVGLSEVHLKLLDGNLRDAREGKSRIEKPLVLFEEDRIEKEAIRLDGIKVVIAEGTYTTSLENADSHIFIDRTYLDTREARKLRAREEQDEFLEKILEIEHGIISSHKFRADMIVTRSYQVVENDDATQESI